MRFDGINITRNGLSIVEPIQTKVEPEKQPEPIQVHQPKPFANLYDDIDSHIDKKLKK